MDTGSVKTIKYESLPNLMLNMAEGKYILSGLRYFVPQAQHLM